MTPSEVKARCRAAFVAACQQDVLVRKPGNVSVYSAGHGMVAQDFLRSAEVSAPALLRRGGSLGSDILGAVKATRRAVGCNTNLGILLLAAPLLHAAYFALAKGGTLDAGALKQALTKVLASTTRDDSSAVFEAIRLARPAGLGRAPREDVQGPARQPLRAVMALAAHRDRIAAQYASAYRDIFTLGLPRLQDLAGVSRTLEQRVLGCYMTFLSRRLDSHVLRKHGRATASRLRQRAVAVTAALEACENSRRRGKVLSAFDAALKREGLNPGTSADLTVASLLVFLLLDDNGR
jgi:triphosphoribosyl-dephospho-CoA synthase